MKLVLLLVFFGACCAERFIGHFGYNIRHQAVKVLDNFKLNIKFNGLEIIELGDEIVLGGFLMKNPKLGNLSSLRVNNVFLLPLQEGVDIHAMLHLEHFTINSTQIVGPEWSLSRNMTDIDKYSIRFHSNVFDLKMSSRMEYRPYLPYPMKSCQSEYNPEITDLSEVVIYKVAGENISSLNIDEYVDGLFSQIKTIIEPYLKAIFEGNLDLCYYLEEFGYKFNSLNRNSTSY